MISCILISPRHFVRAENAHHSLTSNITLQAEITLEAPARFDVFLGFFYGLSILSRFLFVLVFS